MCACEFMYVEDGRSSFELWQIAISSEWFMLPCDAVYVVGWLGVTRLGRSTREPSPDKGELVGEPNWGEK